MFGIIIWMTLKLKFCLQFLVFASFLDLMSVWNDTKLCAVSVAWDVEQLNKAWSEKYPGMTVHDIRYEG